MIIAFAFGLIGALLVMANFRLLRRIWILLIVMLLSLSASGLGIYFILHHSEGNDGSVFFPMFTPLAAIVLMQITGIIYRRKNKTEIIFYWRGLFPVKPEERYVTGAETYITLAVLLLSVILPFSILKIIL